jgi:hypothetical protein
VPFPLEGAGLLDPLGPLELAVLPELPELPEVPEAPELLEPAVVLPVWPVEAPPVVPATGADEELAPPQAARASATKQHAAVRSVVRNLSKAAIQ